MIVKCPECGADLNVDDGFVGQAVQCGGCGTAFTVAPDAAAEGAPGDASAAEVPPIPENHILNAFKECCADPVKKYFFDGAPEVARRYIALEFYFDVYGAVLPDEYRSRYLAEVMGELGKADYLYFNQYRNLPVVRPYLNDVMPEIDAALAGDQQE